MDDELRTLLVRELTRFIGELASGQSTQQDARRVAHSLRGSLGLAGERETAEAFGRIERRLVGGDDRALGDLEDLLRDLASRLERGVALPVSAWPEPPDDLRPTPIASSFAAEYVAQVHDRAARVDAAFALRDEDALSEIYREVHTVKGAALAVGDEVMAWFCHGLEERLRAARTPSAVRRALDDVRMYRGVLAGIVDAPERALTTLRLLAGAPARSSRPPLPSPLPLPPRRPSFEGAESDPRGLAEDGTVRVSSATLEALLERVAQLAQVRAPMSANAGSLARAAESAFGVSRQVREALRLIGPPRPWGAPAAAIQKLESARASLVSLATVLEGAADRSSILGGRVGRHSDQITSAAQSLRTSHASLLFERVARAVRSEAAREDKRVEVVVSGADTPLDRRLAEALLEPLRQLARNAVVHGLEPAAARTAAGKPEVGTLRLAASQRGASIVFTVSDDGAGVDTASIRRHAFESGIVAEPSAAALGDAALLTLLFYPGFSTRHEADLLAGRGVGLDLTLAAVHRLGGTIHLDSRKGQGLTATVVVPAEGALVRVLWVDAGGVTFGLPVEHVGRIVLGGDAHGVVPLSRLVPTPVRSDVAPAVAVELLAPLEGSPSLLLGVESAGPVDEVALRPLPSFVRATGPWAAAIAWADDVRLSLDPLRLLQLAS